VSVSQVCLFIWFVFGVVTAFVAFGKGRSVVGWGVLGFVFGAFALAAVSLMRELEQVAAPRALQPFVP